MTGLRQTGPDGKLIHGSCVTVGDVGVLLLGDPGSGKSDLVLRLVDQPGTGITQGLKESRLVADDQVMVQATDEGIVGSAPAPIAGHMEVRGLGIVAVPHVQSAVIGLVVRLTEAANIERLPELDKSSFEILGISIPLVHVDPHSASAPARIRAAVDWLLRA